MKMKKSAHFTFLVLLIVSTTAIAQIQRFPSAYFLTPDTITIASEPDYPPFCLVNENGNADGFSVELFKAAAKAVGLYVNIKIGLWEQIKQELAERKIDAAPLVGRTPEREALFDFTIPYLSLHGAVFVRKGTTGIASLEDLKDKEIAVMKGDNAEEFVRREQISDKIFTTHTFEEAFRELAGGRYDAVITQRIMGLRLLDEMKIRSVEPLDNQVPGFHQNFCFAVRKGDTLLRDRLNEGLSIIIANDTFEKIREKWLGPVYKEKIDPLDYVKMALYIFVPLFIIMTIILIIILRREVRRQTESLNAEIAEHKQTLKALRESEEKYRSMIMNLMEGFFSVTIAGELLDYNPEFARILKLDPHKDHHGANLPDFWQNLKDREFYLKQLLDQGFVKNYIILARQSDG
ncbi:MAG: transporter substrate-binding domain-containing protein [Fidelibacterota bacterium]